MLESVYGFSRAEISAAIDALLRTSDISVEGADGVRNALAHDRTVADFVDTFIATTNVAHGCVRTATFDRKAARRNPQFVAS